MYQINMLHTLNLSKVICQIYPNLKNNLEKNVYSLYQSEMNHQNRITSFHILRELLQRFDFTELVQRFEFPELVQRFDFTEAV